MTADPRFRHAVSARDVNEADLEALLVRAAESGRDCQAAWRKPNGEEIVQVIRPQSVSRDARTREAVVWFGDPGAGSGPAPRKLLLSRISSVAVASGPSLQDPVLAVDFCEFESDGAPSILGGADCYADPAGGTIRWEDGLVSISGRFEGPRFHEAAASIGQSCLEPVRMTLRTGDPADPEGLPVVIAPGGEARAALPAPAAS